MPNGLDWKSIERGTLRMLSKHVQANHADGGSKCFLAGYQIDAYGVFGQVALVFECKTDRRDSCRHLCYSGSALTRSRIASLPSGVAFEACPT